MSCLARGLSSLFPSKGILKSPSLISQALLVLTAGGDAGWIRPSHFILSSPHNLSTDTFPSFQARSVGPMSLTYLPGSIYVRSIYLPFFFSVLHKKKKKRRREGCFLLLLKMVGKNRAVKFSLEPDGKSLGGRK